MTDEEIWLRFFTARLTGGGKGLIDGIAADADKAMEEYLSRWGPTGELLTDAHTAMKTAITYAQKEVGLKWPVPALHADDYYRSLLWQYLAQTEPDGSSLAQLAYSGQPKGADR